MGYFGGFPWDFSNVVLVPVKCVYFPMYRCFCTVQCNIVSRNNHSFPTSCKSYCNLIIHLTGAVEQALWNLVLSPCSKSQEKKCEPVIMRGIIMHQNQLTCMVVLFLKRTKSKKKSHVWLVLLFMKVLAWFIVDFLESDNVAQSETLLPVTTKSGPLFFSFT